MMPSCDFSYRDWAYLKVARAPKNWAVALSVIPKVWNGLSAPCQSRFTTVRDVWFSPPASQSGNVASITARPFQWFCTRQIAVKTECPRQRPGRGKKYSEFMFSVTGPKTTSSNRHTSEPQIGIEPMTARLRIGCSTAELLWRTSPAETTPHALARTRTATPFSTTTSKWRVYQFHHESEPPEMAPGVIVCCCFHHTCVCRSHPALLLRERRGSNPRPLE